MAMTKIAQLLRQNAIPQKLASGALQNLLVRLGADSAEDPRVAEYLAQFETKKLHPDDFLPGFYGLRLRAVGEQAPCGSCGRPCAYALEYDCGHRACPECDQKRCPQCGAEPRLRLVATDGPEPFEQAVCVEAGCGRPFTLRTIEAHCAECALCWLMSRRTPMQAQYLGPEELEAMGGPFSLPQLLEARDRAAGALGPQQSLYRVDLGEDTETVSDRVYCSNSEITQAVEGPVVTIDQGLEEQYSAARNRADNLENTLRQERLLSERLKARNEQLEAQVEQFRETIDALTAQHAAEVGKNEEQAKGADEAYRRQIQALEEEKDHLQRLLVQNDRDRAVDQARVQYLTHQVQNLQADAARADEEPSQSLVQRQIDELNHQLSQDEGSFLLSRQQPAASPEPRKIRFADNMDMSVSYQEALQRVSSVLDELHSKPAATDNILELQRLIIKNSVRRKKQEALGLDQRRQRPQAQK